MHEEQLKELGLTDNEVKIYLLLLKQESMNPGEISKKLGLHRGYIYDALERMHEKEIVSSILKNNKKYYRAKDPKNLIKTLELKLEKIKGIVPDLLKIVGKSKEDTKVELHKGRKVYQTLIKDMISVIKNNETAYLIGIDEDILLNEVEPIYLEQYLNNLKKRRIKEKIIIKKFSRKLKNPNLSYKEIDEKYIGNVYQIIYSNKVAIFILGSPYHLIIIENKEVAETYRKQFELLWKIAKP